MCRPAAVSTAIDYPGFIIRATCSKPYEKEGYRTGSIDHETSGKLKRALITKR